MCNLDQRAMGQSRASEIRARLRDIELAKQLSMQARTLEKDAEKKTLTAQAIETGVRGYGESVREDVKWMIESQAGLAMTDQALKVGCLGMAAVALVGGTIMSLVSKSGGHDPCFMGVIAALVMLGLLLVLRFAVKATNRFSSKSKDDEVGGRLRAIERELAAELVRREKGLGKEHKPDVNGESRGMEQAGHDQRTPAAGIEVGRTYSGLVTKVRDFGVFVELGPGLEGVCHVSELDDKYVRNVGDVVKVGDVLEFKVMAVDGEGRIKLSRRAALREKHDESR